MNKLTEEQMDVIENKGTERPFSGKYLYNKDNGTYICARCSNPLFSSEEKFDSGSGWPSFNEAIEGSVEMRKDTSHGMVRTEVLCKKCKGHLGHVFDDGPKGKRFCINSLSMGFKEHETKEIDL